MTSTEQTDAAAGYELKVDLAENLQRLVAAVEAAHVEKKRLCHFACPR